MNAVSKLESKDLFYDMVEDEKIIDNLISTDDIKGWLLYELLMFHWFDSFKDSDSSIYKGDYFEDHNKKIDYVFYTLWKFYDIQFTTKNDSIKKSDFLENYQSRPNRFWVYLDISHVKLLSIKDLIFILTLWKDKDYNVEKLFSHNSQMNIKLESLTETFKTIILLFKELRIQYNECLEKSIWWEWHIYIKNKDLFLRYTFDSNKNLIESEIFQSIEKSEIEKWNFNTVNKLWSITIISAE